jgi:sulfite exporter TauE/SafE
MDYIQPLVIGLLGSFHCIGMCGPIAIALPLRQDSWTTRIVSGLLYNLGRTVTYMFMGLIFGLLGMGIYIWGFQQWASIGVGLIMILSVAFPVLFHGSGVTRWLDGGLAGFRRYFGRLFGLRTYASTLVLGLLNGFLPCGLVYIALAGALVSTTPVYGMLHMMLFGLGTIPALLSLSLLGNVFSQRLRSRINRMLPYFIILIGIVFVLRGMNLGIPYISPKLTPPPSHQAAPTPQKPECCH